MKESKKILLVLFVCLLVLIACNKPTPEEGTTPDISASLPAGGEEGEGASSSVNAEQAWREYLVGSWTYQSEYLSSIVVEMVVDQQLHVELTFDDRLTNERVGEFQGEIILERLYAEENEAPDGMKIKLSDPTYSSGDFFFLDRTIYDGKRVMSLFYAENGHSVFDILTGEDSYGYTMEEVMLEKVTGETYAGTPRKNEAFYAVFWGEEVSHASVWLDDVEWTPAIGAEYNGVYPEKMMLYENDERGSLLYTVDAMQAFDILGDDLFKGEVYYVETDEEGHVIQLIDADYKAFLESSADDYVDSGMEDLVFEIFTDGIVEIQEHLNRGMLMLFTGETIIIDGQQCYKVVLGTNHDEVFVNEIHYAVNPKTRQVYEYDVLNDTWKALAVG